MKTLRIPLGITLLLALAGGSQAAEAAAEIEVGKPHPQLVLWTIKGDKAISIDTYRGTRLLLVHFAPWGPKSHDTLQQWLDATAELRKEQKLAVIGVMHEHYRDRAQLFAQWHQLPEPILHDPLNLSTARKVPMVVGLDENGIVRAIQPELDKYVQAFVNKKFKKVKRRPRLDELPNPKMTLRMAGESRQAGAWRAHGDALMLGGLPAQMNEAIMTYRRIVGRHPEDTYSHFRLGVAHMARHDRPERQAGDFQAAINAWVKANGCDRKNKVIRSRIQQFGPRTDKSASAYGWIEKARKAIAARGDQAIALSREPCSIEKGKPRKKFKVSKTDTPTGKDGVAGDNGKISLESAVVPSLSAKRKNYAAVLVVIRPNFGNGWNNEGDPLCAWITPPDGVKVSRRFVKCPNPDKAYSTEERILSFEVKIPKDAMGSPVKIGGRAVYRLGEEGDGKEYSLDFEVEVQLS